MPFHIELRTSLRHARSFNLTEEELRRTVLDPWLAGRPVLLGDRAWTADDSTLKILEGPELGNPDLAFGQGWANAERRADDVTAALLGAAREERSAGANGPAAVVIETDSAVATVTDLLAGQSTESTSVEAVRQRLESGDPDVAAVILVVNRRRA